jgi:hypothetical protein
MEVNQLEPFNEEEVKKLEGRIQENVNNRIGLFRKDQLEKIKYTIVVSDISEGNKFRVDCSVYPPEVLRSNEVSEDSILTLTTTSKILNYSFDSVWGGDAIIIGYGAELEILNLDIVKESLDIICVRLLTRQPVASKQMKEDPLRAVKYLATNPLTTSWAIKQLIKSKGDVNKNPVNDRELWLNKSKCEICQICDVPYLTKDFSETI